MNEVPVIRMDFQTGETVWSGMILRRLRRVEVQIWNGSIVGSNRGCSQIRQKMKEKKEKKETK